MKQEFKNIIKHIAGPEQIYLSLIVDKVGQGAFKDDTFQEIEQKAEEQDFYLQEEEEADVKNIKTAPFNSCINIGPAKRPPTSNRRPELAIAGYSFVFGLNSGNKTMQIIEGRICRAIGTNIFIDGAIYFGHNYEISILQYQSSKNQLCSGSDGRCAQIIEWKCQKQADKIKLSLLRRWNQPLKSLTVGFIAYVNDNLVSITKFSLHQSSSMFIFDKAISKRINYDIKLGKVRNVLHNHNLIVMNQKGINILQVDESNCCSMDLVYQKEDISCSALVKDSSNLLLIGSLEGKIELLDDNFVNLLGQCLVHEGWIISIESIVHQKLISAGGSDKKLIISTINYEQHTLIKLQEIQQQTLCRTISTFQNQIFCSLKNGSIQSYLFNQDVLQQKKDAIQDQMIYSNDMSTSVKQTVLYNKYNKKYMYSLSNQTQIVFFQIDQHFSIVNLKKIPLKNKPLRIDMHSNIISYISAQVQKPRSSSFIKSTQLQIKKSIMYLEDFTKQAIIATIDLDQICTYMKFNETGDRLALGFTNGTILIYDTNKSTDPILLCESSRKGKYHISAIEAIIWSQDGKYLKTISQDNLIFYEVSYSKTKKVNQLTVSSSNGVKEAEWVSMGKFSWKTHKIWARADTVTQYTSIKQSQKYLFACQQNGKMRVYINPAGIDYQQLGRFFYGNFDCAVLQREEGRTGLILMGANGIIFGVELIEKEQEMQQIQN